MRPNALNPKKDKPIKPKTVAKKRNLKPQSKAAKKSSKRPSLLLNLLASCVVIFFVGFGIKYAIDHTINYNPLLGKWRAQTVLGIMEIEFDCNSWIDISKNNAKLISYEKPL